METYIRTPQAIFIQPQQLVVPLFQRPYVWNLEVQWQPLWDDVERQARRILADHAGSVTPHFLGAVVIQQSSVGLGGLQEWTIIDGQQRLTTLQLLFDAAHASIVSSGTASAAQQLMDAVENGDAYQHRERDRFKVWPTNRDQPAFEEVMNAPPPIDYTTLVHQGERLVEAHRFFSESVQGYLADGSDVDRRADALALALLHSLQIVVIALGPDENAQEIFETLNARGTPLSAADLIKNLVFQRLAAAGEDTERAYEEQWRQLESGFWEEMVSQGRLRYQRISLFFNHWLIASTGDEIVASEVFRAFKRYLDESEVALGKLLADIVAEALNYRSFVEAGAAPGDVDRLSMFVYRTRVMGLEVTKPLIMWLTNPVVGACPPDQIELAVSSVESWLIRRMLVGGTTKAYNRIFQDLLKRVQEEPRERAGLTVERFFREQTSFTSYWPGDEEVKTALRELPLYRKVPRARLRMMLEALEDHMRGFTTPGAVQAGEQQVARDAYTLEHVMPQEWTQHWPIHGGDPVERNRLVQTLGNLTLLTQKFNSSVSNAKWIGPKGKRAALKKHSVLLLNRDLVEDETWDEELIAARTEELLQGFLSIWPVPEGHVGVVVTPNTTSSAEARVVDLINAGMLEPGQRLRGRGKAQDKHAILMPDGQLEVDGVVHKTPSGAGRAVLGHGVNGWWFWRDPTTESTLRELWADYAANLGAAEFADSDEPGEGMGEESVTGSLDSTA